MLVDNTFGDRTLSIIQTNFIIRAVIDEKKAKMMKTTTDVVVAVAAALYSNSYNLPHSWASNW
jgi:hypothetical protein